MRNISLFFRIFFCTTFLLFSCADADVKNTQTYLNAMGYNAGPTDGIWGRKTEGAVIKFLNDNKKEWKGKFDQDIFEAIQNEYLLKIAERQITSAITLHDVGGWHTPIWNEGLYRSTIQRISNIVGANTLTVVDTHFITELSNDGYSIDFSPDGRDWTPNENQWKEIGKIADANNLDLQMLVMSANIEGFEQFSIEENAHKKSDETFWKRYFEEYTRLVKKRTMTAISAGVDTIVLGYGGSIDLAQNPAYWTHLVYEIRSTGFEGELGLFSGLSAKENWSGIKEAIMLGTKKDVVAIVNNFDFVMFQLQDASTDNLKRALNSHRFLKIPFQILVITPSVTTGVSLDEFIEPIMGQNNATNSLAPDRTLNFEVQTSAYQAVIDIINDDKFYYVGGLNSWGYHFRDNNHYSLTPGDADYEKSANIRGKPAEKLLSLWFKAWQQHGND